MKRTLLIDESATAAEVGEILVGWKQECYEYFKQSGPIGITLDFDMEFEDDEEAPLPIQHKPDTTTSLCQCGAFEIASTRQKRYEKYSSDHPSVIPPELNILSPFYDLCGPICEFGLDHDDESHP